MNLIEQQVSVACSRLNRQRFLALIPWVLAIAWFVALIAIAIPKIFPVAADSLLANTNLWAGAWLGGSTLIAIIGTMVFVYVKRATAFHAAVEIDRRAGLRERTATAVTMAEDDRQSVAGQLVVADANKSLDGLDLREAFQVRLAKTAPLALLTLIAAATVGWLAPNAEPNPQEVVELTDVVNSDQLETTAEDLKDKLKEQLKLAEDKGLEEAAELFRALDKQASEFEDKSEMTKKEALVKLNDLKDKLENRAKELGEAKQMREAFSKLDEIKKGPAEKLMQAMKDGDFAKAAEQLEDLAEQLNDEDLSPEEKKQLQSQIADLADKMKEMAEEQKQQQQALEEQIADAQKNGNLEEAAELQEQLDQLKKQQGNMPQQLENLSQALQQAADGMQQNDGSPPNSQQTQQALQQMAESMEVMQQQMDELEAIEGVLTQVGECKGNLSGQQGDFGQPGNQPGQSADSQSQSQSLVQGSSQQGQPGSGMGEGQGVGARPESETEVGTEKSKVDGNPQAGEVVLSGKVGGPNQKGQSKIELQQAIQTALSGDVEPVGEQRLPRSKRDQVKEYFEKLRKGGD